MRKKPYIYESQFDGMKLPAEKQVKFLMPESFHERLETEKLLQKKPMQELLCEALEISFLRWKDIRASGEDNRRASEQEYALKQGFIRSKQVAFSLKSGEEHAVQMWIRFMRKLPKETVEAQKKIIHDLLDYFQSSRRKGPETRKEGA